MGNTSSTPKVTAQDKAVLQVKLQKDKLVKYQKKMNILVNSERDQIKKYLRLNDKRSAKVLLKKLKFQEKLLDNVSDQIFNLENMIHNIEFKLVEKEFLKGLTNGNVILTKLNKEMNINDIEKLVDEVNENIAYQEEIDQVLSTSIIGKDVEDEIDEELAEMERQELGDKNKSQESTNLQLPSVSNLPEIKDTEEEEEEETSKIVENSNHEQKRTALLA